MSAPSTTIRRDGATTRAAGRAGLARSSAAVAAGTLLSRLTGLLRVVVLAAAIGKESLADTYNLANITPNIVYELLVGGVLAATLFPCSSTCSNAATTARRRPSSP